MNIAKTYTLQFQIASSDVVVFQEMWTIVLEDRIILFALSSLNDSKSFWSQPRLCHQKSWNVTKTRFKLTKDNWKIVTLETDRFSSKRVIYIRESFLNQLMYSTVVLEDGTRLFALSTLNGSKLFWSQHKLCHQKILTPEG